MKEAVKKTEKKLGSKESLTPYEKECAELRKTIRTSKDAVAVREAASNLERIKELNNVNI